MTTVTLRRPEWIRYDETAEETARWELAFAEVMANPPEWYDSLEDQRETARQLANFAVELHRFKG